MKKISVIITLFLLTALSAHAREPAISGAQEDNVSNYIIESTGGSANAKITGYIGSKAEISIPYVINRMTIIAIGDRAFYDRKLTSVIIPNGIILIGSEAFARNEITSITIGANVSMNVNSFGSGFTGFYSNNGQRAGTYILSNGAWSLQIITEPPDEAIPDKKPEPAKKSGVKMEFYGDVFTDIGLLDYGPSSLIIRPGFYFGSSIEINKFELRLCAGAGGFLGLAYPEFEDFGITYGYFFGSLIEMVFDEEFGLGIGGGMARFYFTTVDDIGKDSFFPFVELSLMFSSKDSAPGLYLRYYINDDNFYNKFSVGIRIRDFF